ncbi:MAG: hypothetical protein ACI8WB_004008 [Phenylobacterium sp.]|jgi:hypothetical protein
MNEFITKGFIEIAKNASGSEYVGIVVDTLVGHGAAIWLYPR